METMVSLSMLLTSLPSDDFTNAAGLFGVLGGLLGIILLFIYGIISFLVPIFIYRIMRRNTLSYQRLGEIRDLLRKQEFLYDQANPKPPSLPQIKNVVTSQGKGSRYNEMTWSRSSKLTQTQ
jgi:hypothetical protein